MLLERVPSAWDKPRLRWGERRLSTPAVSPEWPKDFPKDCPERDARDAQGTVFHFVFGDDGQDFQSAKDSGTWVGHPDCERASLSCWDSLERAQARRSILKKFHGSLIAKIDLTPAHGKMKSGTTGHCSLWLRAKYLERCREIFVVVEE
jgi:hypothetical protein